MAISDIFAVIKKGEEVANPTTWKNMQVGVNALSAFMLAVVNFLPAQYVPSFINEVFINQISVVVLAVYNIYTTYATSRKVGVGGQL